ncbi:MAG: hypothetical protein MZV65_40145 [Chromatiales bacterium]|nr:hypothetical protein [Chromatiales bacterium]
MRLSANTGSKRHLNKPLGFRSSDRTMARAGMNCVEGVDARVHDALGECLEGLDGSRVAAASTRGTIRHDELAYQLRECSRRIPAWQVGTRSNVIAVSRRNGSRASASRARLSEIALLLSWSMTSQPTASREFGFRT